MLGVAAGDRAFTASASAAVGSTMEEEETEAIAKAWFCASDTLSYLHLVKGMSVQGDAFLSPCANSAFAS